MLNQHPELLRATKFVGQSQGKQEIDKGFNQKEQKKVCRVESNLHKSDHKHIHTTSQPNMIQHLSFSYSVFSNLY
jgi:ERCC4-related helicase